MDKLENIVEKQLKRAPKRKSRLWKWLTGATLGVATYALSSTLAPAPADAAPAPKTTRMQQLRKDAQRWESNPGVQKRWLKNHQEDMLKYGKSGLNRPDELKRAEEWLKKTTVPNVIIWYCVRGEQSEVSGYKVGNTYMPIGGKDGEAVLNHGERVLDSLRNNIAGKVAGPLQQYFSSMTTTDRAKFLQGVVKTAPLYGLDVNAVGDGLKGYIIMRKHSSWSYAHVKWEAIHTRFFHKERCKSSHEKKTKIHEAKTYTEQDKGPRTSKSHKRTVHT